MAYLKIKSIKIYLLVFLGTLSLAIGIIGVIIPLLPTTPFLLLASFCYLRSSKRMYNWLINHRIFGSYIYCYMVYRGVPRKTKIGAFIFLWLTLIISMILISYIYIRVLLLIVGIGVTIHLLALKTLSLEDMEAAKAVLIRDRK